MENPTISVIIPTYNGERFIANTVHSVLCQTYPAYEIIVVIDGSSDQTSARLQQFGNRIRVLEKNNGGVSSARNAGITIARGEHIAFLDDDDHWHQEKLQRYVNALHIVGSKRPLFLFSNFRRKDFFSGRDYPLTNTDLNPYLFEYVKPLASTQTNDLHHASGETAFELLLRGYPIYPSTIMISKALLNSSSWPQDFKLSEDLLFSLRVSQSAEFVYIDEILTTIHRHDKNASINLMAMLESDTRVLQWIEQKQLFNIARQAKIRRAIGGKLCGLGWHYRKERKRGSALAAYLKSIPYPGSRVKAAKGIVATLLPDFVGPIRSNPDVNRPNH